jgi:CO/xanthine dehydrogenase FAD-binding subunit
LDYYRPEKLDDALNWLSEHESNGTRIAAGCTDLLAMTENSSLAGHVLDLTGIEALRGIEKTEEHWRIGGLTTWSDIVNASLPPAFTGLKLAAREVGSIQIQNRATIAGNLCNASPAADGVPCLLTLNASVELLSNAGRRVLKLSDFIKGPRQTALFDQEIVTAILVPRSAAAGIAGFSKLGARKYLVISIAMVAARLVLEYGRIKTAAIAVGACSPVARRLGNVEELLVGEYADKALCARITDGMVAENLSPIDDVRADAAYRRLAAGELVRRTVDRLFSGRPELAA